MNFTILSMQLREFMWFVDIEVEASSSLYCRSVKEGSRLLLHYIQWTGSLWHTLQKHCCAFILTFPAVSLCPSHEWFREQFLYLFRSVRVAKQLKCYPGPWKPQKQSPSAPKRAHTHNHTHSWMSVICASCRSVDLPSGLCPNLRPTLRPFR